MLLPTLRKTIESPWTALEPIAVGGASFGTPSVYVTVEEDGVPVLRIDVHESKVASHAFQESIEWADFIVVGFGDRVHLVSLSSRKTETFSLTGYFGHLYPVQDQLLVSDAEGISCFDRHGAMIWRSPRLGLDGVVVNELAGGVIVGSGEWDPPGGWRSFRLLLATGVLVSSSEQPL